MTTLEHTALRKLALRVLAQHSGSPGAEALTAAARRTYEDLAQVSSPLIGQVGVDALIRRALHVAQREYPWIGDSREPGQATEPLTRLVLALERQEPAVATDGAAAVFAHFAGLLLTFVGEPVTMQLLRKAWPEAFSDASTEER
jgi:hypothetical protein